MRDVWNTELSGDKAMLESGMLPGRTWYATDVQIGDTERHVPERIATSVHARTRFGCVSHVTFLKRLRRGLTILANPMGIVGEIRV